MITQEKLEELVNALSKEIREWELKVVSERSSSSSTSVAPKSYRKNQRTEEALRNFNYAISWFLGEIDKHIRKVPNHELMVQLRSGYYSKKAEEEAANAGAGAPGGKKADPKKDAKKAPAKGAAVVEDKNSPQ